MPDTPRSGNDLEKEAEPRQNVEAGEQAETSRRRSLYLWSGVVGALLAAVLTLMLPAWFSYRSLCAETNPGKVDARLSALRTRGPMGTELARRYLAGRFELERKAAAGLIHRHQVLFHGLPVKTVVGYLGPADTGTKDFVTYLVTTRGDAADFLEIRLRSSVVESIHIVEKRLKTRSEETQERRNPIGELEKRKSLEPPRQR